MNQAPYLVKKGKGFQFFEELEKVWTSHENNLVKYLGRVLINGEGNEFHLFLTDLSYFGAELDFDSKKRSHRTLMLLDEEWRPIYVV